MTSAISVAGLSHVFSGAGNSVQVLRDINLSVAVGETLSIVGPSGCGKTTLLRCIAGTIKPSSGSVALFGERPGALCEAGRVGIAPQEPTLLPWRTAESNVDIVAELGRKGEPREIGMSTESLLELVGLSEQRLFYPAQLSGGMRSRISLARALRASPRVLLLDEPFASVDLLTRTQLMLDLPRLLRPFACATVLVTHSIDEAVYLGDKVLVMSSCPGTVISELRVDRTWSSGIDALEQEGFRRVVRQCRDLLWEHA